ncbi:hypothetical protein EBO15_36530 [Actinomadura harenae]|uniref:Uncharacterized protein n=1 Tax=Actinomadura harenae TaxID=2483351 RepID=A0A3M2LKX9_9ACTN|nr:hypothetical protein EBO15_36530 [Actinomadura harenae]
MRLTRTSSRERYLSELAELLAAAGWTITPRFELSPPLVRVTHPALERTGLSVHVEPLLSGGDEVAWFCDSSGRYLGTRYQLPQVLAAVHDVLGPLVADAGWPVPSDEPPARRSRTLLGRWAG